MEGEKFDFETTNRTFAFAKFPAQPLSPVCLLELLMGVAIARKVVFELLKFLAVGVILKNVFTSLNCFPLFMIG